MTKAWVIGQNEEKVKHIKDQLLKNNFDISRENPDLVMCSGGDGTFLLSEREYPGIPKILTRDSRTCQTCSDLSIPEILKRYKEGDYKIKEIKKLQAKMEGREFLATNDITIRNTLPTEAVRFRIKINGEYKEGEFIGDGLVIATSYGSSAYFHSITKSKFEEGMGLAFNNITNSHPPILFKGDEKIEIEITRGPAILVADNNRDFINLVKNDRIIINLTENKTKKILLDKNI